MADVAPVRAGKDDRALRATIVIDPADSFACVVAFAMSQPDEVDVNEIIYRPTKQEL
jgi:NADP-dependent 3-hydroxy acid dehydrogenase YdfG